MNLNSGKFIFLIGLQCKIYLLLNGGPLRFSFFRSRARCNLSTVKPFPRVVRREYILSTCKIGAKVNCSVFHNNALKIASFMTKATRARVSFYMADVTAKGLL